MSDQATIRLVGADDAFTVHSPARDGFEGVDLDQSPDGVYSTGFTLRTTSGVNQQGGHASGISVPIREVVLPFHIQSANGDGIEDILTRFRNLWGSPPSLNKVRWEYTGAVETRTLMLRLNREMEVKEAIDWNINEYVHVVVSASALNPMFEGPELRTSWVNPSSGSHTGYFECWNPTDQPLWLEWAFDPATQWRFPDFSFGQERKFRRPAGADAARMIITPALVSKLSVMVDPMMRTYVSADGSNITPLFDGVEPVYQVPPYTGSKKNPIILPVVCNGPAGAKATLIQRRFWSAESGLYR